MRTFLVPGDRQEIEERLARLRETSPRKWGKMTPHQMVCHLIDSFEVALGEKQVSPATNAIQRSVVKWIALYTPLRWPKGVPTRPEIDQASGHGRMPRDFERDVVALRGAMERFVSAKIWGKHPIFGAMSTSEWMRWGYLHTDHHLRQFGC